ncbi:hypothetical protein [Bacillus sp. BP-3]|uniref:hypothetical protein n=1 Tax=Bacillus sp. BP-3 TaxID=3022773 RepID=UPI00232B4EDF|nr:hypothetical protein [Bacillus sp. BP-3]MDC2866429.1 hypothetical protein [Bacillus sp. BP-3]
MHIQNLSIQTNYDCFTYEQLESEASKLPANMQQFYLHAVATLRRELAPNECFYYLSTGAFRHTAIGFLFFTDRQIIMGEQQGLSVKCHTIHYRDFTSCTARTGHILGIKTNAIYLEEPLSPSVKEERVTHIPDEQFQIIYKFVQDKITMN